MDKALFVEMDEQREIRKDVFAICCPFCGKYHYKMIEGHGMFTCEKCKRNVEFIVSDGRMTLFAEKSLKQARHSAGIPKAGRAYALGCYSGCVSEG